VIVLNGVFAFAQEERAQHAAEGLRQMLPRRATVLRDGVPRQIPADEIVPNLGGCVGCATSCCERTSLCTEVTTGPSRIRAAGAG
jgi:hypothetical protein